MIVRILVLVFFFLNTLPLALSGYTDNSNFTLPEPDEFQTKAEYRAIVAKIREDLLALKPKLLIDFCTTINFGEDTLDLIVFYYNQQYKLLASGFDFIDSEDSKFEYIKNTIMDNLKQEQAACNDASCESKNECSRKYYDGLLGSAMIIERILDGATFNQLYKEALSLA